MTAQYLCNFTGTARAPCCNLGIAVQGPYNYSIVRLFVPNDHIKSCDPCTIIMLRPCGARTEIVRCFYKASTGYSRTIFEILYNAGLNKTIKATAPVKP